MARLEIRLLGTYQITRDAAPITAFDSNKVRGLLAYLAVESERAHTRDALAALLWPESNQKAALASLRGALANLRRAIGDPSAFPPYLLITPGMIQFNPSSDCHLDIADILRLSSDHQHPSHPCLPDDIQSMAAVVDGYRGSFLEGFSIADSAAFEEWVSLWRERLSQAVLGELSWLASTYEGCAEYPQALQYARRQVALNPWLEEGHRQVMRILARSGQRGAALGQYESCERILADELGVEPAEETRRLYDAIRAGKWADLHPAKVLPAPGEPPYRGLRFFDQVDAGLFFGREALTARLAERVKEMSCGADGDESVLAVVGASGSGKSSLVRAGVAPVLRKAGWEVRVVTPTAHPLAVLNEAGSRPCPEEMRSHRCLFIIDQFEELFSLCHVDEEREAFLERVFALQLPVLLTLRADFYGHCSVYPKLRAAVSARQEYIGAMDASGLRRAIEEPARRGGWELEQGLVNLLLDEAGTSGGRPPEPGALPLLEHALLETWERRRGRMMTVTGYLESGGVRGAIAQSAERVYGRLSSDEQALARRVFLRLTELGEGTQDTRRRVSFAELYALGTGSQVIDGLLSVLAGARLVTLGEETAEVAHEALIREWPALQRWLADDREGLRLHRHLTESAAAWERLARDEGELYRGARLARAQEWAGQAAHSLELTSMESEFLSASRQREEREVWEREEQRRRELEAAQKLAETERIRAEEREQAAQRLFREERLAYARELAAHSKNRLASQPDLSLLLAVESVTVLEKAGLPVPWDVQQAVHDVALISRLVWSKEVQGIVDYVAYSPDGKRVYHEIQAEFNFQKVFALDAETGEEIFSVQPSGICFEITPNGKYLAATSNEETYVWDAITGQKLLTIPLPTPDEHYIASMNMISPDGHYLVLNTNEDLGYLVDLEPWYAAGSPAGVRMHLPMKPIDRFSGECAGNAFSPDGKTFTTAWNKDNYVCLRDTETVQIIRSFKGHTDIPTIDSFSPDGRRLATGSFDRTVRIWDVDSARELMCLSGHVDKVHSVTYSPDGQRLASASNDALVILWDAEDGRRLLDLHVGGISYKAAFSPDGERLFCSMLTGGVVMWDVRPCGRGELRTTAGSNAVILRMGSPDGSLIVEARLDGCVAFLDSTTFQEVDKVMISSAPLATLFAALSQDNAFLAVDDGARIRVWDIQSEKVLFDHPAQEGWNPKFASTLAFSPDGGRLATSGYEGGIRIWDLASGQVERDLPIRPGSPPKGCQFSPDGKLLAMACWAYVSSSGGEVWVWDLENLESPPQVLDVSKAGSKGVCFSPDGKHLATYGGEIFIKIWDTSTWEMTQVLSGHTGTIEDARYSADGRYFVSASSDGMVKAWDAQSGVELLSYTIPWQSSFTMAFFTPDGRRLVVFGDAGYYHLLALQDFDELLEIVRARTARDWKPEERRRYLR